MSSSRSLEESRTRFAANFPEFVVNSYITLLLWIFGIAVFIPLSSLVLGPPSVSPIIATIFFVAIAFSGTKVLYSAKRALESYVEIISHTRKRARFKPSSVRLFGYIGIAIIGGIIFAPIAWLIDPVLGGIAVVVVVLTAAFLTLPLLSDAVFSQRSAH